MRNRASGKNAKKDFKQRRRASKQACKEAAILCWSPPLFFSEAPGACPKAYCRVDDDGWMDER